MPMGACGYHKSPLEKKLLVATLEIGEGGLLHRSRYRHESRKKRDRG